MEKTILSTDLTVWKQ